MGYDPLEPKTTAKWLEKERKSFYPHHQGGGPPHQEGAASHNFGYPAHTRSGKLRLSGDQGAHRLGRGKR